MPIIRQNDLCFRRHPYLFKNTKRPFPDDKLFAKKRLSATHFTQSLDFHQRALDVFATSECKLLKQKRNEE